MVKMLTKTKKALALALTTGMLVSATVGPVEGATGGWREDNKGWWYQYSDGSFAANKWEKINGAWYYFDANGYMVKNSWKKDADGKWYYLGANGAMVSNSWQKDSNGKWYYLGASGAMVSNSWQKDTDGKWYYFDANGIMMANNWMKDSNGKWYYLGANGAMVSNSWQKDSNGKWYYLDVNGAMVTNDWIKSYDTSYEDCYTWNLYCQKDCYNWYYVGADGAMKTNEWVQDKAGNWYYLRSDGYMEEEGFVDYNGKEYYVAYNGVMQTGAICDWGDNAGTYYFGNDGARQTGDIYIDGIEYLFAESGYSNYEVSEDKNFYDGIPCLGIGLRSLNREGGDAFYLNCQKYDCKGGETIKIEVPEGYWNVESLTDGGQDFYDSMWLQSILTGLSVDVMYREGNCLNLYNYGLENWDVKSTGTISTSLGTMKYVVSLPNGWRTHINGFVQVDSEHYIRLIYDYSNEDFADLSDSEIISRFSEIAQWIKISD